MIAGLAISKANQETPEGEAGRGAFWTFYGQGGAGKTSLAASTADYYSELTGQDDGVYLHIDAEGGKEAISHKSNVDVVEIFNYRQFDQLTQKLKQGGHGYKAICADNLCEIINLALRQATGSNLSMASGDQPEIQEWGAVTREILLKTREYRDMARAQGIDVFFNAWDADEKDDRNVLKKELAFSPSLRKQYPGIVTVIGHVEVLADPNMRKLTFAPNPRTVSKFRRAPTSAAMGIPFEIYYGINNLPMPDILKVLKGGGKWPETKYPKPGNTGARSSQGN